MQPVPGTSNITPIRPPVPGVNGATPMPPGYLGLSPQPIAPTPRRWYDRVADAILGDEESSPGNAHSKYALICKRCFTHNGLVRESDFEETQFVCMKCGFLNPPPKATKTLNIQPAVTENSTHVQEIAQQLPSSSPALPSLPSIAPVSTIDSDTDDTPSKRPAQKLTQRRQTRNSRKSMKDAEGYNMELDS
ncbi:hypothetical protein FRC17_006794 [Serendipita sp. 399]|nr:hypothetical protein FRC17_006794 [Serendipita sp. 399]